MVRVTNIKYLNGDSFSVYKSGQLYLIYDNTTSFIKINPLLTSLKMSPSKWLHEHEAYINRLLGCGNGYYTMSRHSKELYGTYIDPRLIHAVIKDLRPSLIRDYTTLLTHVNSIRNKC